MTEWVYYPLFTKIPPHLRSVVEVFENHSADWAPYADGSKFESDQALAIVRPDLESLGFLVESSKKMADKIRIPVLYGRGGEEVIAYEVDGYDRDTKTVIEVESGRAISNYQVLKDLIEACLMEDVDYICIALRLKYRDKKDFEKFNDIVDAIYKSNRLQLPLKGILVIGY